MLLSLKNASSSFLVLLSSHDHLINCGKDLNLLCVNVDFMGAWGPSS